MAKARRKRHTYTPAQRTTILAAAKRDGLTAVQVQKKFGVTPVTYYSWRKKQGLAARRGRGAGSGDSRALGNLGQQVREEVRAKVRAILPRIVRNEVSGYLDSLFRGGRGRPRKL
jgi:transposase-like protein